MFPKNYIAAGSLFNTAECHIPQPLFPDGMEHAAATHRHPKGEIFVPSGWTFENSRATLPLQSGSFALKQSISKAH